jgi:hypothetical protein
MAGIHSAQNTGLAVPCRNAVALETDPLVFQGTATKRSKSKRLCHLT